MKKVFITLLVVKLIAIVVVLGVAFTRTNASLTAHASTESDLVLQRISLFNTSGTINPVIAQRVLDAVNGNDLAMEFRLFPTIAFPNATETVRSLSTINFRFVYAYGDNVTFWASQAYRNSLFNPVGVGNNYAFSELRQNLIADWNGLTLGVPNLTRHINQLDTTQWNAIPTDRIWLPTWVDMHSAGWNLPTAVRSFDRNGFSTHAFLRSPTLETLVDQVSYVGFVSATNVVDHARTGAVRPALHVSLASLQYAIDNPPPPEIPDLPYTPNNTVNPLLLALGIGGGVLVLVGVASLASFITRKRRYEP